MKDSDRSSDGFEVHNPFDPFDPKPVFLPVPSEQGDKAFEEFFDSSFRSRHSAEEPFWVGDVAKQILGLDSALTYDAFHNILKGRTPDGKSKLFTSSGPTGPCAWHRICAAPGSVSVLWALGSPEIQDLITSAHNDAVYSELGYAESRVGGDINLEPEEYLSSFLFACFPGRAAHAQSPQLYTSLVWINAAFSTFTRTQPISREQMEIIGTRMDDYESNLLRNLRSNLGWFRVPDYLGVPFEIVGVSVELYREHSWMFENQKAPVPPILRGNGEAFTRVELLECWRKKAKDFGWGVQEAAALTSCVRRERVCLEAHRDGGTYLHRKTGASHVAEDRRHRRDEARTLSISVGKSSRRRAARSRHHSCSAVSDHGALS
jgi:hypothetical protein